MDARTGQIAVIFRSRRTKTDAAGYQAAAQRMEQMAARQPGYCGFESLRGEDGAGITISYWSDEVSARAWRDQPDHKLIRDLGRGRWYEEYEVIVASVTRSYAWHKP